MQIGGLVGTFLVGVVATKCNGNKSFSCLLFAVTCFVSLLLLHTFLARVQDLKNFCRQEEHSSIRNNSCYDSGSIYSRWDYIIIRLLLFFAGLGVNGPKTLLIVTIQEISNPAVSGTVAGIAGLIGQLGASCAGIGVGYFLETQGWNDFLLVMAMPTCLTAVCLTYPSFTIR